MKEIREKSPILREMLDKHEIGMVRGMYDLSTGRVEFIRGDMKQLSSLHYY